MIKTTRKMKREADRAFHRLSTKGCCRCGHKPMPGLLEVLVRGPGQHLLAIHEKCSRKDDMVLATGVFVAKSPQVENDRQWFEENPMRVARLRRPYDAAEIKLLISHGRLSELRKYGESPNADDLAEMVHSVSPEQIAIVVVQRTQGVRLRFILFLKRDINSVPVDVIEELGASLLAEHIGLKIPAVEQYARDIAEAQLMELSEIASAQTGKPSMVDIARAAGKARISEALTGGA